MHPIRIKFMELLHYFSYSWQTGIWNNDNGHFVETVSFFCDQHGNAIGLNALSHKLAKDVLTYPLKISTSNYAVAIQGNEGAISAYVYGYLSSKKGGALLFGGAMVLRCVQLNHQWRISEVRMSLYWSKGQNKLISHWANPPGENGWNIRDPLPSLVSEYESVWALFPDSDLSESDEVQIGELFSRYAWALDQADWQLYASVYCDDAQGDMQPIGYMEGKRNIVALNKGFRRPWPVMQHFGIPLEIKVSKDGKTATMLVGRIIPERSNDEDGIPIYGAHYPFRLRRDTDGKWKFSWVQYVPGWFRHTETSDD
ncbi:nuclear transport factor 2 family protein (plasmid) [Pantoea sp. C3]|uniref:nuclear transport factor 2 family protein n=1 Tax=Pantoea phytostimulans TaxID=2769024 RepID=UPI0038F75D8B